MSELRLRFAGARERVFDAPLEVLAPTTTAAAFAALERLQAAHAAGYVVAGVVSFEFGYACCGLARPRAHAASETGTPLMRVGVYAPARPTAGRRAELPPAAGDAPPTPSFAPSLSFATYAERLARIARAIREGDVYQVNYTVPFLGRLDPRFDHAAAERLFERLGAASRAPYRALATYAGGALVSISPELFLRTTPRTLCVKPMKGTAPPGAEPLLHAPKNRAEHVMIVDLLRNDLGRVCERVEVPALFSVERYPTFSTLTSTVVGRRRAGVGFAEILRALFPCGSVTGAPKIAALRMIGELEERPREAYCGAIGYLLPDGRGVWNVAIRTLQFDYARRAARLDLGGGVTADSTAADEWAEMLVKGAFARAGEAAEPT